MKHGPAAKVSRQPASGWVARRTIKRRVAALVHEGFSRAMVAANGVNDIARKLLNEIGDVGKGLQ